MPAVQAFTRSLSTISPISRSSAVQNVSQRFHAASPGRRAVLARPCRRPLKAAAQQQPDRGEGEPSPGKPDEDGSGDENPKKQQEQQRQQQTPPRQAPRPLHWQAQLAQATGPFSANFFGPELALQLNLLTALLVKYPLARGTAAVLLGYLLHLDPFGNVHWNEHDFQLGLACALPVVALDALLMLPSYAPKSSQKQIRMKVPRAVAAQIAVTGDVVDSGMGNEGGSGSGSSSEGSSKAAGGEAEASSSGSAMQAAAEAAAGADAAAAQAASTSSDAGEGSSSGSSTPSSSKDSPAAEPAGALSALTLLLDSLAQEQQQRQQQQAGASPTASSAAAATPAAAEKKAEPELELVEIERTITVREPQPPLAAALYKAQLEKSVFALTRHLALPSELVLLLTVHLSEEMLYRAVLLGWVAGWTIDRLYEAGLDDAITLLPGLLPPLAVPQAGALLGAAICAGGSLALLLQRNLLPLKRIKAYVVKHGGSDVGGSGGSGSDKRRPGDAEARKRAKKVVAALKRDIVLQQRWGVAIEGSRELVEWASFSTAYLLSGNLLAPFAASCAADAAFTLWQRLRVRQLEASRSGVQQRLRDFRAMLLISKARAEMRMKERRQRPGDEQGGGPGSGGGSGSGSDGEA